MDRYGRGLDDGEHDRDGNGWDNRVMDAGGDGGVRVLRKQKAPFGVIFGCVKGLFLYLP